MTVDRRAVFARLGLEAENFGACAGPSAWRGSGTRLIARSPTDQSDLATIATAAAADIDAVITAASAAALARREVPAP